MNNFKLYLYYRRGLREMASVEARMEVTEPDIQRLQRLYPRINEKETPLPRQWSSKDKYSYIGLSQNNLRVHYKGGPVFLL